MECETTMSVPLPLTTRQRMAGACAVYRIYGADDCLLYVGMTGDLRKRFADHASQRWFLLAETIRVEWFATEATAREAERRAIRSEHPRRNIMDRKEREERTSPESPHLRLVPPQGTVTLTEAVALDIVDCTLHALRKASQRAGFPPHTGFRGLAKEYDALALAEFDARRR